jgi:hypothetical protein
MILPTHAVQIIALPSFVASCALAQALNVSARLASWVEVEVPTREKR